jgi:hypothetical protein
MLTCRRVLAGDAARVWAISQGLPAAPTAEDAKQVGATHRLCLHHKANLQVSAHIHYTLLARPCRWQCPVLRAPWRRQAMQPTPSPCARLSCAQSLLLLLQWHVTPQARRQWERYRAMIAAAEDEAGTPSQQPEAGSQDAAAGCQPSRPADRDAASLQPSTETDPAAAGADSPYRAAKRLRVSSTTSSRSHTPCNNGSDVAILADGGSVGCRARSSSQGAADADDCSIVHDTVGCVVVDAEGAAGWLLGIQLPHDACKCVTGSVIRKTCQRLDSRR